MNKNRFLTEKKTLPLILFISCTIILIFPSMKIGIWQRQYKHTSVSVYTEHVVSVLKDKGIDCYFISTDHLHVEPGTSILWDPSCVGGMYPPAFLCKQSIPLVVTLHGVSNMALPLKESFSTLKQKVQGIRENMKRKIWWRLFQRKVRHVITVSEFSRQEIHARLHIPEDKITAIHHGFDRHLFYPEAHPRRDYFFHISAFSPRKNLQRMMDAYRQIKDVNKPPFLIVSKGCTLDAQDDKIQIIRNGISTEQLGDYMRHCLAFVFPSLYEGFGMPLAEAMACGVPVITSDTTACPEIIDGAGLLVPPDSTPAIKESLEKIYTDTTLQEQLRSESLERAKKFSWKKCTEEHFRVFSAMQ